MQTSNSCLTRSFVSHYDLDIGIIALLSNPGQCPHDRKLRRSSRIDQLLCVCVKGLKTGLEGDACDLISPLGPGIE